MKKHSNNHLEADLLENLEADLLENILNFFFKRF
jgi:hypothetical protein